MSKFECKDGLNKFSYSAFKEYATRWAFKQPYPADFFRTMEDVSGVDLDWFWRGWFYSTDYVDIALKDVKEYYVSTELTAKLKNYRMRTGRFTYDDGPFLYLIDEKNEEFNPATKKAFNIDEVQMMEEYVAKNYTAEEKAKLKAPKYFYEVEFEKLGGMIMPILVELQFEDGSTENHVFPAQIWRMNDKEVIRTFATQKAIVKIQIDPKLETADIDVSNNTWPKEEVKSKFVSIGNKSIARNR